MRVNAVRRHRGLLATALLLALGVTGLAGAGYYLWLHRLPPPSAASRGELLRWLVLRDVAAEPPGVQRALVDRLQKELLAGLAAEGHDTGGLSGAYREQLERNLATLQRVWFEVRTEQYARLAPDDKQAFLEEQIAVVAAWSSLSSTEFEAPAGDESDGAGDRSDLQRSAASRFFDNIERWIASAEGARREQMNAGVRDGLVCWLAMYDLAEQPVSLRRDLAVRIARELDAGLDAASARDGAPSDRKAQLVKNGWLLLEAWLQVQAREYADLEGDGRRAFLDQRIDSLARWNLTSLVQPEHSAADSSSSSAGSMAALSGRVDGWIERADQPLRGSMQQLADDFRRRMMWRALTGALPRKVSR